MNIILEMTTEQQEKINNFMNSSGKCMCGAYLDSSSRKCLLATPGSSRFINREQVGKFKVSALCDDCFDHLAKAILERRAKGEVVGAKK